MRTYVPVREHHFTLTEYEPDRPWVVRASGRHVIKLPDDQDFGAWAADRWPDPRFKVELERGLDPWSY